MTSVDEDAKKSRAIIGHVSATPELFATIFNASVSKAPSEDIDVAIFAINPSAGIDQPTIDAWRECDDLQIPRIVIVTVLEGMEMDFDDAVLVANRVFDPLVTPYLVLHGESGTPIGTISLSDLTTTDYSTTPPTLSHADEELAEMVKEFQEEFQNSMMEMDDEAFSAGILFPAIPINPSNGLGIDIVNSYLSALPSRS
jgi:translation elongation factor EF-G